MSAGVIRVPGKWVLAGEHAVLRGATAVALPHPELGLEFHAMPSRGELVIEPASADSVIRDLLRALEDAWQAEGRSFPRIEGHLRVESSIPIGSGLGSSAALCVALTRWLSEPLAIAEDERFEFARRLEHRFHGRSSGMDVAVCSAGAPVSFSMERGARALGVRSLPRFTFHDTGLRARTSECVLRVERFRDERPAAAMQVDDAMAAASRTAMEGLSTFDRGDREQGLGLIAAAMKRAQECFYTWELVPGEARRLEQELLAKGALAAKLTGAGGGGFVVALWA